MGGPDRGAAGLEFRLLGPLEVWRDGERVPVEAPRERGVLAVLLLHAGRVVAADRLIELVWADDVPPRARNTVHTLMWRLRRWLGSTVETRPPGYLLRIDPDQLDLHRFEALLHRGRQAVDARQAREAADLLGAALELWRGEPLTGVAADGLRRVEVPRLSELYLEAVEARIEAHLLLGRHAELVGELRSLVADHPLREGLSGQLMTALYRSGRQAEALETYRRLHTVLDDELGVEPGPAVQRLHQAVLRADQALDAVAPARSAPAAGRPAATGPAQLPADVAAFTGRSGALRQLDGLLRAGETAVAIAAIAGTAGVGKTALAVHWAHRVRDRFDGGQLYVNLRGYASAEPMRPIEALSRFLRALGLPADQVPVEVEEAADLYRTLLADRRMLVVLDNARSAEQVRPLLPGSAGCLVLVTSRDRLGGLVAREGAHRLTLDVLPPDEAGALLTSMLGTDRMRAEPDAAAALADSCARLPLALRIAAANLIDRPQVSLARYVAELHEGNRLAALTVDGDEQAAVRAAFDLSYTGLPADSQRLFRLLGLVPGADFTVQAAAAVAGIGVPEARRRLAGLIGAHLIDEPAAGRYTFHDLLRLYARELVDDRSGRPRLFEFYLSTVDSAAHLLYPEKLRLPLPPAATAPPLPGFADHAAALAWLDAERPNLVAAILDAAGPGPRQFTWLLADALRGYFYLRMLTADWHTVAHAALAAARTEDERQAEAAAHLSLADLDWRASRHKQAIDHYAQALTLARQTGWLEGQATALGNLGTVYWQAGRLDDAAEQYRQALALNRRTGWLEGQAINLGNLAAVSWQAGCLDEAAEHNAQALALHRKTASRSGEALAHNNLGETYHLMGRLAEALDHLEQARDLHHTVGDRGTEAETLRCLAAVHRDVGHLHEALELGTAALDRAEETGNRRHQAEAHNSLGAVQRTLGDDATAVGHHERALNLARDTNNRYSEAEALIGLAAAHDRLGRPDQALVYATQALGIARRGGYRVPEGQALTCLAAVHLHRGEAEKAREYGEQALDVHTLTGHQPGARQTRSLLAKL